MTALTAPAPATRSHGWRGFPTLLRTETKVWLRDGAAVFFGLAFPTVLLVGIGLVIPGMRDPIDAPASTVWAGLTPVAVYVPTVLAAALATAALTVMPATFGAMREKGVLRRLSTTPMRPQGLIVSHYLINLGATLAASVIALVAGQLVFGLARPQQLGVVVLSFALGLAAMFAAGTVIAARVPRASTASAVSMPVYFPMLLLAGMWTPGPIMPDALRVIGKFTPLGAASQAMTAGWFEDGFPLVQVVVMVVWTAVLLPIGIRLFRWT
ncbi:ABC-2 type transporter [Xylanimonas cellulosilytica DSM 15894]|uniref:Transport permease protein n=1 Tax=Xylanimonas cellulosilytica (strain DSM 15894 / JCM 12276 / CECT 5975 / KCTC 9989 / LMG 20990 / NBRC 107835 / XIL07) TaxID=446471 RepID=D1BRQ3_XYLCX|nr:ABC transporter permease [Xylanimonas cellulosilytica]ACZ32319.1 ABC-2 type transporter [Xylanimonas cellulosilytica DSM 15894]